uniref:5-hydroxytryptamine (serotonin) receptor 3B n=1 Tax=Sinocyclocheilus rhinocerous TaxID=307959 RepID=A0A673JU12_9TELE
VFFLIVRMSSVLLLSLLLSGKSSRSALNQLTRLLLRKYNCGVRPVQNWTKPTTVYIDLIIQSVLDGEVTTSIWYRQIWNDEFLVWDPEEFDGITEISLSSDAIWVPDVIISEFVDVGKSPVILYVYVNCSGTVKNYKPIQVVSACHLEIYAFPFDKQNCTLTFRSWLHSVDFALWRPAEEIANDTREFMNGSEWELLSVPSHYWTLNLEDRDYAQIQFNVLIRSIFFMVVDVTSFYLPLNSGTRITFKTSILLGFTVIRVNMMDEIPATAIKTPLIGAFFAVCMVLLVLSLALVNMMDEIPATAIKTPLIGAFFAVCMVLLVLSLALSIFVVKLLHYSEKEVKEMSISACLLDKYGSMDQSFIESAFTSMKTLDDMEQSGGRREKYPFIMFDLSPEPDLFSLTEVSNNDSPLEKILQEVVSLRLYLQEEDNEGSSQSYWVELCLKVDKLLFSVYLLLVFIYVMTLLLLWGDWSSA